MECPRCGSANVKPTGDTSTGFECRGECLEKHPDSVDWEYIYFQYERGEDIYCWPAVGVMYKCHGEELRDVRDGKKRPDFV